MVSSNFFGIDLGTSNIKIYNKNDDSVLVEKNMIAIENKKNLFAYGDSAYEMYEKAPSNIRITYPLSKGVIADIANMQLLLKYFVSDIGHGQLKPADFYIAVPTDVTEVEKRAFYDVVMDAGIKAKNILVVEKAVADGLGLGIDVKSSQGCLIVNVGYDTTEISVLSLGGIVLSKLVKVGGKQFDEAICNVIRREYSLIIGEKSAENLKIKLVDLERNGEDAVVCGRDIVTGLPVERKIPTDLLDECLYDNFMTIIDQIKVLLERTPPELSADIYRNGLYVTGGASLVVHLKELIAQGTGLKVNTMENPISGVVLGLSKVIKDDYFRTVAYSIEGMSRT